jgi:hypothetical protein
MRLIGITGQKVGEKWQDAKETKRWTLIPPYFSGLKIDNK